MAQADLQSSVSVAGFLSFYIPVLAIYTLGYVIDRYFIKKQSAASHHAVFALGSSYSNTVLVGLPIIIAALGEQMVGIVFMIITFHSALLFTLTFLLSAKSQQTFSWRAFAKNMLLNPVVLSISSGLAVNLLGFTLFDDLVNGLSLLAKPAIACALFVLGANLAFYKVADNLQASIIATIIKLAVLPCGVYFFAGYVFHLEQSLLNVLVLLSASPLGVNAYLIANQIKQHQATLASTVVLSTVLSVVSFSVWLSILL